MLTFLAFLVVVAISDFTSPGWLLRSEGRASDLFPDYPEYKTPTLSYETHPKYLQIRTITGLSRPYLNTTLRARVVLSPVAKDRGVPFYG